MMMDHLRSALAERGIDNPDSILTSHEPAVVERSITAWDRKRKGANVGAGLLVQMIRNGGPSETTAPRRATKLNCWHCRAEFDPFGCKIKGRAVAPSMYCSACLTRNFESGRWQETFIYKAAKESK